MRLKRRLAAALAALAMIVAAHPVQANAMMCHVELDMCAGRSMFDIDYDSIHCIADVPTWQRLAYLFPNGIPKTKEEVIPYLDVVELPICDASGNRSTIRITTHRALIPDLKEIFEEMVEIGFPICQASSFNFRVMNNGTNTTSLSHHSYGAAVDINYNANPHISSGRVPDPNDPYCVTQEVIDIWAKHGFHWGGNFRKGLEDPMHFTYTNH